MSSKPAYQVEPVDLRPTIWERGHVEPWELLRICAWKSAQGLANLAMNDEEDIRSRTRNACSALREFQQHDVLAAPPNWDHWQERVAVAVGAKKARTGLLGLHGVGYPVATAVLAILNPAAFPVMDRWAVRYLYGTEVRPASYEHAAKYRTYAEDLVYARDALIPGQNDSPSSIHDLDQQAMRRGMDGQSRA